MAAGPQAGPAARPQVIILTGPTAVGKTAASLKLARAVNGEIISADSVQIYRGLDIGSAKLPEAERQGIPHHLIDVADTEDEFSAGHFFELARAVTSDILKRGKTPVVVGGTGFYLRWFIYGKPRTPASDAQQAAIAHARLDEALAQAAAAAGHELTPQEKWHVGTKLVADLGDPHSAERLGEVPNNYYRLGRVLEILLATGKPLAELDLDTEAPLDYDFRCFFLDRPRLQLYPRIDLRCEEMLRDGVLKECKLLLDRGFGPDSNSATRAIGYRQGMERLLSWSADPASLTPAGMIECLYEMQATSRQYSHRQIKWARGVKLFRWLDADRPAADIVAEIMGHLHTEPFSGDSGQHGLLTKEEQRGLRCYQTKLQLFNSSSLAEGLCDEVRSTLLRPPQRLSNSGSEAFV